MTTLQAISRLLSIIYDLLFLLRGTEVTPIDVIEKELSEVQEFLEPYADDVLIEENSN